MVSMTAYSLRPDTFGVSPGLSGPPGMSSIETLLTGSGWPHILLPSRVAQAERTVTAAPVLDGRALRQGGMAESMTPGPGLYGLADAAASDYSRLSDNELLGAVHAAERLRAHADWQQMRLLGAFADRQAAACEASADRGDRRLHREGEFGAEELGMELVISRQDAAGRLDLAGNLGDRLPQTMTGLRDGAISLEKAKVIAARTWQLSDADAARADETLAEAAPGIRKDSLYRKAAKVSHQLDPEAAQREKKESKKRAKVETGQENSGNFFLSGREMDAAVALAARSDIWEEAARLRRLGLDGTLDEIRCQVFGDRLRGIDTAARLGLPSSSAETATATATATAPSATATGNGKPAAAAPAQITLLVPASVVLRTSEALSDASGIGLLDGDDTRDLLQSASGNPRTRWCMTAVDETTGQAVAHACIPGRHPWTAPAPGQHGTIRQLLEEFRPRFEPVARGTCDHRHREDRYQPSRKLQHLVHARTATCPAVGCEAQADRNEDDHTVPWPEGATDECNISPPCTRHHHA
jgi:hypothetical protein